VDGGYLLSGDTLFVAGVGRPDLGGHVVEWGRALYDTLQRRLADLPGETRVLPAHYGGPGEISAEGVVWGRLGDLRRTAPEMQIASEDAFVEAIRAAVLDPPKAYADITRVNLGAAAGDEESLTEWELGKNQCAASAKKGTGT
jgi:glyoxylase-like metal-dependent hydrolase (beta-lactamase superfamily II)